MEETPEGTRPGPIDQATIRLPNGWQLTPLGEQIPVGDLPLAIALHPDGRYAAIANGGYLPDYISIIDLQTKAEVGKVPVPHCWTGIEFSPDGRELAVAITSRGSIYLFDFNDGQAVLDRSIPLAEAGQEDQVYPSGLAYTPDGRFLVVGNLFARSLSLVELAGGEIHKTIPVDPYPHYIQVHPAGDRAFVSSRAGNSVQVVDLERFAVTRTIPVGSRPNHMTLSADGRRLFVACANSGDAFIIDTQNEEVLERVGLRPFEGSPAGTTPNGVAVTRDGGTLYVANADNNDIAVVDVSGSPARLRGRLPTGWYPTGVALCENDGVLLVTNGKGLMSRPNPQGPQPTVQAGPETEYIGRLFRGTLSMIPIEDTSEEALARHSATVERNNGWTRSRQALERGEASVPPVVIPRYWGQPSRIKYVLYIIKENRTYDQVFGDLPEGDGDPALCLFPEAVTPNHHKLARAWVLFDNFYVDSEVSMDGHPWSTAAIAVDYLEKIWPSRYSRQGLFIPGRPDGSPAVPVEAEPVAQPDEGYIWDMARRAGLGIRSYWERAFLPSLQGYLAPADFLGDSFNRDQRKAEYYIRELREYERNGGFPNFQVMSLGNDHTRGTQPGEPTPYACVGDNDRALGMIIEALSRSRFWPEMVVFVVEDDAQNGPDHVDAHRTVALVASPYARRGFVDHTQYSTVSMLKTIELMLGLPPMTQYDAAAVPMVNAFMEEADLSPFRAEAARVDLDASNPEDGPGSGASMRMNLEEFDDLSIEEEQLLNEAIWKSVMGPESEMPRPVYWATHWAFGRPDRAQP